MLVFNTQEANSTTDQITGAAKSANVPIVELTEQMPKEYTNLLDWMSALVDQFAKAGCRRADSISIYISFNGGAFLRGPRRFCAWRGIIP